MLTASAWNSGEYLLLLPTLPPASLIGPCYWIPVRKPRGTSHTATGGPPPPDGWWALPTAAALAGLVGPLISGALEEPAWRGFAQPLLQERMRWLPASIVVGLVWATWHLWPVLAPGDQVEFTPLELLHTYIRFVATAVIYGWLFHVTRSLPLIIAAHVAHNVAVVSLPIPDLHESPQWALLLALAYLVAAVAVVTFAKRQPVESQRN